MNMQPAIFTLLVVSAWALATICNAADREQTEISVKDVVKDLCLSPSERGKYWEVQVQGEGNSTINIVKILGKAGVAGELKFNKREWQGVQQVLREQQAAENADYRQCAKQLTPLFLQKFESQGALTTTPPFRVTYYRMGVLHLTS
jgi:hypothetical protein